MTTDHTRVRSRLLGRTKLWHLPLRVAAGAFILNAGIGKRNATEEAAERLKSLALSAFPLFEPMPAVAFARRLSAGEIALGAALLNPAVPPAAAGAALSAFSGGLVQMYLKAPGFHEEGSIRPTQQGTAIAKDVWLLAIGVALIIDGLDPRRHR